MLDVFMLGCQHHYQWITGAEEVNHGFVAHCSPRWVFFASAQFLLGGHGASIDGERGKYAGDMSQTSCKPSLIDGGGDRRGPSAPQRWGDCPAGAGPTRQRINQAEA